MWEKVRSGAEILDLSLTMMVNVGNLNHGRLTRAFLAPRIGGGKRPQLMTLWIMERLQVGIVTLIVMTGTSRLY